VGLSLDGIASGLDTAALISSQMAVEALPQTLLKAQVTDTQAKITDFQALNTQLAALTTLSTTSLAATALQTFTASSSSSVATAQTTTGATAGSLDFTVEALAQAQTAVTAPMTEWPGNPPVMTVVNSAGVRTSITATSSSLTDMVTAINASKAGVVAVKVASGVNSSGVQQYRLQLTSSASGTVGAFTAFQGTGDDVAANTAPNLLTATGAAITRTATDASITLWAGTTARQVITSSSNTFTGLLTGVDATVSATSTTPVTLTIAQDATKATAVVQSMVDLISTTLGLIDTKTASVAGVDADGNATATPGTFTGDSTISSVRQSVMSAASAAVNGVSPSAMGVSFDKNGSIQFDTAKFATALATDPASVEAMFTAIATRVAAAATAASDKTTGSITTKITGSQTSVKNLAGQVSVWTDRLAAREAILKSTYAALEVTMGQLNATSAYLTSQLNSMNGTSTSSSSSTPSSSSSTSSSSS
jgi:flagellar hook-associated protein 2